ncbi:hypothetical protein [Parabacteroides sp.]
MRKKILVYMLICLSATVFAQADKIPQAISYQAVARDAAGKVLIDKAIGVKVEILKGAANGSSIYSEIHKPTSSTTGAITLLIGQGNSATSSFADIDWGADTYFLQLSIDIQGGSDYKKVSTTQILPAPFALYASKAGSVENGGSGSLAKYAIIPVHGHGEINDILAGRDVVALDDYPSDDLYLNFNIVYLDGNDQNIDVEITGIPDDVKAGENSVFKLSPSSTFGRLVNCNYEKFKPGSYPLSLLLKDKNGQIIKSYPFTLKIKEYQYN